MTKHGYRLHFQSQPPPFAAKNNASSFRNKAFVEQSISELLENNCIQELDLVPYCCNLLTVAVGGKLRLVLDLRHVNLKSQTFKYEDLRIASEFLENDYYLEFQFMRMTGNI